MSNTNTIQTAHGTEDTADAVEEQMASLEEIFVFRYPYL